MTYEKELEKAIRFFEAELKYMERSYGGGGYDPHEATRLAGKISGIQFALNVWKRVQ